VSESVCIEIKDAAALRSQLALKYLRTSQITMSCGNAKCISIHHMLKVNVRKSKKSLLKRKHYLQRKADAIRQSPYAYTMGAIEFTLRELKEVDQLLDGARNDTRAKLPIEERISRLQAKIAKWRSYTTGDYGQQLGLKADTPCNKIEDCKTRRFVRQLAIAACMPPRPKGAHLCHRCDEPKCVSPQHWFWGTRRDNIRDMHLKGRKGNRSVAELLVRAMSRLDRLLSIQKTHTHHPSEIQVDQE
jgi:hypothetical protein